MEYETSKKYVQKIAISILKISAGMHFEVLINCLILKLKIVTTIKVAKRKILSENARKNNTTNKLKAILPIISFLLI